MVSEALPYLLVPVNQYDQHTDYSALNRLCGQLPDVCPQAFKIVFSQAAISRIFSLYERHFREFGIGCDGVTALHIHRKSSGTNGSVGQALKYATVKRLDYIELDPALIRVSSKFFPTETASLSDPRARIHYADGGQFLRTTRDRFDVVIINLPDPQTAQLNRFYTGEFFSSVREHVNSIGLLALQLHGSEDYVSPELAEFLRCIYCTLHETSLIRLSFRARVFTSLPLPRRIC